MADTIEPEYSYWTGWSRVDRQPIDPLSPQEASGYHDKGQLYTVLIGEESRPGYFLDIHLDENFVSVSSLDRELRVSITNVFQADCPNQRLFWAATYHWFYDLESVQWREKHWLTFQRKGIGFRQTVVRGTKPVDEKLYKLDVSKSYINRPLFGDYDYLLLDCPNQELSNLVHYDASATG